MGSPLVHVLACNPEFPPGARVPLLMPKALWIPPPVKVGHVLLAANICNAHVAGEGTLDELWGRTKRPLCRNVVAQGQGRALHQRSVGTVPLNKVPEPFCVASGNFRNRRR